MKRRVKSIERLGLPIVVLNGPIADGILCLNRSDIKLIAKRKGWTAYLVRDKGIIIASGRRPPCRWHNAGYILPPCWGRSDALDEMCTRALAEYFYNLPGMAEGCRILLKSYRRDYIYVRTEHRVIFCDSGCDFSPDSADGCYRLASVSAHPHEDMIPARSKVSREMARAWIELLEKGEILLDSF